MRRTAPAVIIAMLALAAPATASAVVKGEGVGGIVFLQSDGAGDTITLSCESGSAPGGVGAVLKTSCGNVDTVFVQANGGNDTIQLEGASRAIFPKLSRVEIVPGEGEDIVFGSQVGDEIFADEKDVVSGNAGDDLIEEGAQVNAGEGEDLMIATEGPANGGGGDDVFQNPRSVGPFTGGAGADTFELSFPTEAVLPVKFTVEDAGLGFALGEASAFFFWNSVERAAFRLPNDPQTVDASRYSGSLEAEGHGGPDVLIGGPGEDFIYGGGGDDEITGGGGFDYAEGGAGADKLLLRDSGIDRGVCGEGVDSVSADASDLLAGCEAIELPPVPDTTPPDTKGLKGPKSVVKGKTAKFTFASSEPGGTFKCRLDKGRAKTCSSPYKVKTGSLKAGKHTLTVTAVDAAGNADPTPAKLTFKVKPKPKHR